MNFFASFRSRGVGVESGDRLFAVNTPDNRLEIFDITATGLALTGSVVVGLEPVAVVDVGKVSLAGRCFSVAATHVR